MKKIIRNAFEVAFVFSGLGMAWERQGFDDLCFHEDLRQNGLDEAGIAIESVTSRIAQQRADVAQAIAPLALQEELDLQDAEEFAFSAGD